MEKDKQPLKRGTRIIPAGKKQVNINVLIEIKDKLDNIALREGVPFAEVCSLAFNKFIEAYEKKNGPVKFEKGKGLKRI